MRKCQEQGEENLTHFFFPDLCVNRCVKERERDGESVVFGFTDGFVAGHPLPDMSVLKSVFSNR